MACHPSLVVAVLLVAASSLVMLAAPVDATVKIVVDIDGAVEDFAVLATILRHSTAQSQLAIVTINGNGWGSMKSTEVNLKKFLALAGKLDAVQVGLGSTRTLANSYNASTHVSDCKGGSQGVPRTPAEAALRKMKLSRYDIDRVFGATSALPSVSTNTLSVSNDAVQLLVNLLGSLTTGDTINFIALKSLTTLANFATSAQQLNMNAKFASIVKIHSYETRGNWALDLDATNIVFQTSLGTSGIAAAAKYLYAPQFWQTSVTFSYNYWAQFEAASTSSSASKEVKWLHTAWSAMKLFFDGSATTGVTFFNERGPASSLIALCVVDVEINALCQKYYSANTTVQASWKNTTASALSSTSGVTTFLTYDYLSGNNITSAMFLQYPATSNSTGSLRALTTGGTAFVIDTPASYQWPSSQMLATLFWTRWLAILKA